MKRIFVTIMILIFTTALAGTVLAATGVVNTQGLNLREEASTASNVITQLDKDATVNIIEELTDWCKISYGNYTGFVSKQYLKINQDDTGTVTEANQGQVTTNNETPSVVTTNNDTPTTNSGEVQAINREGTINQEAVVYSLPLLNSTIVTNLPANSKVTIISEVGKWKYILTDSVSGWVISSKIDGTIKSNTENPTNANTTNPESNSNNTEYNNGNTEQGNNNNGSQVQENNSNENNQGNNSNQNNQENNGGQVSQGNSEYPTTMYVNVDAVNVRDQATTDSDIIASVELNNEVTVLGVSGDWYKVKINQSNGYIKKDYLSTTKKQ